MEYPTPKAGLSPEAFREMWAIALKRMSIPQLLSLKEVVIKKHLENISQIDAELKEKGYVKPDPPQSQVWDEGPKPRYEEDGGGRP